MATYNRPGVYVNELPLASAPLTNGFTANAAGAVIAQFPQGPDVVTRVTSWYDFVKRFGGYSAEYPATFSVNSFFKNGGAELYVKRVLPAASTTKASVAVSSAPHSVSQLSVSKASRAGTTATITTTAAHTFEVGDTVTVSGLTNYATASISKASKTSTTATITTVAAHNLSVGNVVTVSGLTDDTSGPTTTDWRVFNLAGAVVTAVNAVAKTFTYTVATSGTVVEATPTGTGVVNGQAWTEFNKTSAVIAAVTSTTFNYAVTASGTVVEQTPQGTGIVTGSSTDVVLTLQAKHRGTDGNNISVIFSNSRAIRLPDYYDVSVYYTNGTTTNLVEQFNGVVLNDATSGDYLGTVLSFGSAYIVLSGVVNATYEVPELEVSWELSGATTPEDSLTYADYTGNTVYDPTDVTPAAFSVSDCAVFGEFEVIDQPLVFFLPDVNVKVANDAESDPAGWDIAKFVYNSLIEWADAPVTNGRHFVIVETEAGQTVNQALSASGNLNESSRAAVYFPHVYTRDPIGRSTSSIRKIGPSGAVAGLYMYTDRQSGPFKAPAGISTKISDAIALEVAFSPSELDALNSGVNTGGTLVGNNVVNAIRNIPGAGIVVMGARTTKQDGTANRYVNMRRSLTYIEKRLNDLGQFALFENNTEQLWARLITVLGGFLNEYRNQGGLRGTTVEESYYIKCDAENNPNSSIQAGEVHVEIGVALEYPAEFVVINLSQKTAE
jgi:hypothetical protein